MNNRKEAIKSLISDKHDVAILDDGFQDLSIEKDFSILCFNSRQLIGNGFLIPAGGPQVGRSGIENWYHSGMF